jgi:hypothetical protein
MATDDHRIDYEQLNADEQLQIVEQRLHQYEAEHYGALLNRRALEQASDLSAEDKRRQLEQLDRTLASLASSIQLHRAERESIRDDG